MKLRWYQQRNRVTAADISAAREHGVTYPMMVIKEVLEDRTALVLQYFDEAAKQWVDVPTVIEVRDPPTIVKA